MPGKDTIYALSTPPGRSGVAVVRVSGGAAREVIHTLAAPLPEPRYAALRRITTPGGEVIDQGLVLWFAAPATETGEDMAEFHLHGSRAVISALLEALGTMPGLRPAEPGEFARRAFENGKMDLTAVEGLADLVDAEAGAQRRQALRQLAGEVGKVYEGWRQALVEVLALVEAGIDFSDESDVPETVWQEARPKLENLADEMARHLADDRRGERIREGATVVVAGPPNAGKSSLLNALARRDVAIVSEIPGTTRDVIEVRLDLGGMAATVVDTAGLREAGDAIEAEGVRRAEAQIAGADLVLWVFDVTEGPGKPPEAPGEVPVWPVANKCDLVDENAAIISANESAIGPGSAKISAITGAGVDELVAALTEELGRINTGEAPLITRERHRREIATAESVLRRALMNDYEAMPDLVAEDLRTAATALGRIVGRIDVEDVLDSIFRDFCIGK